MGKFMRKAKITSDIAVMELTQSTALCNTIRTRAKTLALQQLEASNCQISSESTSYLQLRNRRLERPKLGSAKLRKSAAEESCSRQNTEPNVRVKNPKMRNVELGSHGSGSISCSGNGNGCLGDMGLSAGSKTEEKDVAEDYTEFGVEGSFGENDWGFEGRERGTRESTPCSLIRGSDTIRTPSSSTRPVRLTASNQRSRNIVQQIPTTREMEDFFTFAEEEQQRLFTEKYNFDVVNDLPLPGRYEWVRVYPKAGGDDNASRIRSS